MTLDISLRKRHTLRLLKVPEREIFHSISFKFRRKYATHVPKFEL